MSQRASPGRTREFVEPFPISAARKDLYAELFDFFKATEYLGDPEPIKEAPPGLRHTTPEAFMRRELFAAG